MVDSTIASKMKNDIASGMKNGKEFKQVNKLYFPFL